MKKTVFLLSILLMFSNIIIPQDEMYVDDPIMPDMEEDTSLEGLDDLEGLGGEPINDTAAGDMMGMGLDEGGTIDAGELDFGESEIPGETEGDLPSLEGMDGDAAGETGMPGEDEGLEGLFPEEEASAPAQEPAPTPPPKKKKPRPKTILASTLTNKVFTFDGEVRWFRNLSEYLSWDTSATSVNNDYKAEYIGDDMVSTAWISGDKNDGTGETITMYFDELNFAPVYEAGKRKIKVNSLRILNGYVDSEEKFEQYNRMKKIKIMKNGKTILYANMHDSLNWQTVKLPYPVTIRPYDKLQVKILEIFPEVRNARNTSLAVTEIALIGGF